MVTNSGAGYSQWGGQELTRWRSDATLDGGGIFCYIHEPDQERLWSSTYHPVGGELAGYSVDFTLDRAVFRRFDVIVPFDKPTREQLVDLLKLRLGAVGFGEQDAERLAGSAEGWSFADVVRACDDAVRSMALDDREEISERDVVAALEELKRRELPARS